MPGVENNSPSICIIVVCEVESDDGFFEQEDHGELSEKLGRVILEKIVVATNPPVAPLSNWLNNNIVTVVPLSYAIDTPLDMPTLVADEKSVLHSPPAALMSNGSHIAVISDNNRLDKSKTTSASAVTDRRLVAEPVKAEVDDDDDEDDMVAVPMQDEEESPLYGKGGGESKIEHEHEHGSEKLQYGSTNTTIGNSGKSTPESVRKKRSKKGSSRGSKKKKKDNNNHHECGKTVCLVAFVAFMMVGGAGLYFLHKHQHGEHGQAGILGFL